MTAQPSNPTAFGFNEKTHEPLVVFVTGVCGVGKSAVGQGLATHFRVPFVEGDAHHPASNIDKMEQGVALDDADRWPWLQALAEVSGASAKAHRLTISACSGLKLSYRRRLAEAADCATLFILLHGDESLIARRMAARKDHFMPPSLLVSQLATLELPSSNEAVHVVDISPSIDSIVATSSAIVTSEIDRLTSS